MGLGQVAHRQQLAATLRPDKQGYDATAIREIAERGRNDRAERLLAPAHSPSQEMPCRSVEMPSAPKIVNTMITPKLVMQSGFTISCIGHVAVLVLGLIFAGANPFDTTPADSITVDIVSADDIVRANTDDSISAETTTASLPPATPTQETPMASSPPAPQTMIAARAPPQSPPPPGSVQFPQTPAQIPQLPAQTPEPNIANMFGLPLALPDGHLGGGFDAPAIDMANIANDQITMFHTYLKACLTRPAEIRTADNVKAVLRIYLKLDGTLAADPQPIRVEGVSRGGGALYQSAVAALRKCQPYKMLPPDRYQEWKVLDLSFTPEDFDGAW
jgi:hypothetical protein